MCTLELGVMTSSELLSIPLPCEYKAVADKFVTNLSAMRAWPKLDIATLTFGPDEEPYVMRMENVWLASVSPCADYRAYRRQLREAEENERLLSENDSKEKKT